MRENLTDSELLEKWRQGSKTAFSILFDRYFNKLLKFTLKSLDSKEQAEELVMDVLVSLWKTAERSGPPVLLGPYLFRSVKNALIDHLRSNALKVISLNEQETNYPHAAQTPDQQFHLKELNAIYLKSLGHLSPRQKRVFELSRFEGKSHLEISRELNVSINTVKKHITASLHLIRSSMKEHSDIAFLITVMIYAFV